MGPLAYGRVDEGATGGGAKNTELKRSKARKPAMRIQLDTHHHIEEENGTWYVTDTTPGRVASKTPIDLVSPSVREAALQSKLEAYEGECHLVNGKVFVLGRLVSVRTMKGEFDAFRAAGLELKNGGVCVWVPATEHYVGGWWNVKDLPVAFNQYRDQVVAYEKACELKDGVVMVRGTQKSLNEYVNAYVHAEIVGKNAEQAIEDARARNEKIAEQAAALNELRKENEAYKNEVGAWRAGQRCAEDHVRTALFREGQKCMDQLRDEHEKLKQRELGWQSGQLCTEQHVRKEFYEARLNDIVGLHNIVDELRKEKEALQVDVKAISITVGKWKECYWKEHAKKDSARQRIAELEQENSKLKEDLKNGDNTKVAEQTWVIRGLEDKLLAIEKELAKAKADEQRVMRERVELANIISKHCIVKGDHLEVLVAPGHPMPISMLIEEWKQQKATIEKLGETCESHRGRVVELESEVETLKKHATQPTFDEWVERIKVANGHAIEICKGRDCSVWACLGALQYLPNAAARTALGLPNIDGISNFWSVYKCDQDRTGILRSCKAMMGKN